mgnify:CR=1 FL=1
MQIRYPHATWRPLPEALTQQTIRPVQVIFHTIVGSAAGAIRIMEGDQTPGESHLVNPFVDQMTQLMPLNKRADCNWKANAWVTPIDLHLEDGVVVPARTVCGAISIESEDDGSPEDTPWNVNQVENFIEFLMFARMELGIPLQRCPDPFLPGVGYHSMFGMNRLHSWEPKAVPTYGTAVLDGRKVNVYNPWTNTVGKSCPGPARIAQFDGIVAEAARRLAPPPATPVFDPPSPQEAFRMLIIVGNKKNQQDPRRWAWDGGTAMRLLRSEADYNRLLDRQAAGLVKLHPAFSTLASPFWMEAAELAEYGFSV